MAGRSLTELFPVSEETEFSPEFFNSLIAEIGLRISALQVLKDGLEAAFASVESIALGRINLALEPALEEAGQKMQSLQGTLEAAQQYLAALQASGIAVNQVFGLQASLTAINNSLGEKAAASAVYTRTEVADLIAEAEDRALALSIAL